MSGHHHRHCVYCGKLSGDARTCVAHAPLVLIDPYFAPFWSPALVVFAVVWFAFVIVGAYFFWSAVA